MLKVKFLKHNRRLLQFVCVNHYQRTLRGHFRYLRKSSRLSLEATYRQIMITLLYKTMGDTVGNNLPTPLICGPNDMGVNNHTSCDE